MEGEGEKSCSPNEDLPRTRKAILSNCNRLAQRMGLRENNRVRDALTLGERLDNRDTKRQHGLHGILHDQQTYSPAKYKARSINAGNVRLPLPRERQR